jgi:hypothetical protein
LFVCLINLQGRREEVKAGGGYFENGRKCQKKRLFSSKIRESLRDTFSQNWRKFEGYFLQKSEKTANKFFKAGGGTLSTPPPPGRGAPVNSYCTFDIL